MIEAEEILWNRFYSPKTHLFYDYITSYEKGNELAHLPRPDEIAQQYPNPCGYGTGMEDCMISAGVMMTAVLNRYKCDKYKEGPRRAKAIFEGIERSIQSVPGEGFVARGFSPFAPNLFYFNSSRDQVTHAVMAMWEYFHSGLPSKRIQKRIRKNIRDVADRMQRNVTPENDYDFLQADGSPCKYKICKMENVMPHEAARLATIYAAAWDITGETKYYNLWREKIRSAAEGSLHPDSQTATYGLLQMQESLALLTTLEDDLALRKTFLKASSEASSLVLSRIQRLENDKGKYDLTELAPDWRIVGGLVNPYRLVWYYSRESGEILLTLLKDPNHFFPAQAENFLRSSLELFDFYHHSGNGLFYLLAAWWTWKASQEELQS
ncbi:MAG: hypothetical protein J5661_00910 [Bacteroidaceae bacterium]|nr:hypothetical protein [Bacteroidaceae bacterium]